MSDQESFGQFTGRDVLAVVNAFNAGMRFSPPVITPEEFRDSLRAIGMPIRPGDGYEDMPQFELPQMSDQEDIDGEGDDQDRED
jgi:hypothetical protein